MRGGYSRPAHFSPVDVGWMRSSGHLSGVSVGLGRRGWYLGFLPVTPCRHKRQVDDLQQRFERTVGYFDELLAGSLDATTQTVVEAARRSLVTKASS